MIGFIVTNLTNDFYINIGAGIDEVLKPNGYKLFYVNSYENLETEKLNVLDMVMHSADGLIIAPTQNDCSYMGIVIPENLPTIFIDRKPTGFIRDSVLPTNQQGVFEAVTHLISKGHTRIGFIGSRKNDTMNERLQGYHQALHEAGIPYDPDLVMILEVAPAPMYELLDGQIFHMMEQYLATSQPTAIMSGNGLATVGIHHFLRTKGLSIPKDIALISFDDQFWYSMLEPAISAVIQDPHEIGVQAARLLMRRVQGETFKYKDLRIPTSMVIRESC
jgi:LacI family transcriptional regulator